MLPNSDLRLALVGAGKFGMQLGQLLRDVAGARLVAVYSQPFSSAAEAARMLGVDACASYAEVLARQDVDAVVIATSHDSHCELAVEAARSAKHIFCEKPMAITVAQCTEMIQAADMAAVRLLIGHSLRLHPIVSLALDELDRGALGRPVAMAIMRYANHHRAGWWSRRASYGGMLYSPAIHEIDLMNRILGRPGRVSALAAPRIQPQIDYDDTIFALIAYDGGAIGSVASSISDPLEGSAANEVARITCEGGSIALGFAPTPWIEVQRSGEAVERVETGADYDPWSPIRSELTNFVQWVAGTAEPFITPHEARTAVAVCEAAYRSLETGRPADLLPDGGADAGAIGQ